MQSMPIRGEASQTMVNPSKPRHVAGGLLLDVRTLFLQACHSFSDAVCDCCDGPHGCGPAEPASWQINLNVVKKCTFLNIPCACHRAIKPACPLYLSHDSAPKHQLIC